MRLDVYVFDKGMAESRRKAKDLIEAGHVTVGGKVVTKPAFDVNDGDSVEVTSELMPYVGRGGLKLKAALDAFGIDVRGRFAIDIGASTGGFTDCLLIEGASKVTAVDSGSSQLAKKLRDDPRVISLERTNARYLESSDVPYLADIVTMDVSFISQTKLYDAVKNVLKPDGIFISLIKPQFEAGRENIGKNGIVRDEKVRAAVIENIKSEAESRGFSLEGVIESPIEGGDGNREYLAKFVIAQKEEKK